MMAIPAIGCMRLTLYDMEHTMRFLYSILCAVVVGCCVLLTGCQSAAVTSAKLYLQENQPDRAREQLEKALETTPDNP